MLSLDKQNEKEEAIIEHYHYSLLFGRILNTGTAIGTTTGNRSIYLINGDISTAEKNICPECEAKMHSHDVYDTTLKHIPFGEDLSAVRFHRSRFECLRCGK